MPGEEKRKMVRMTTIELIRENFKDWMGKNEFIYLHMNNYWQTNNNRKKMTHSFRYICIAPGINSTFKKTPMHSNVQKRWSEY